MRKCDSPQVPEPNSDSWATQAVLANYLPGQGGG